MGSALGSAKVVVMVEAPVDHLLEGGGGVSLSLSASMRLEVLAPSCYLAINLVPVGGGVRGGEREEKPEFAQCGWVS